VSRTPRTDPQLADILTSDALPELADANSYERGETYLEEGRVVSVAENLNVVTGRVQGTAAYQVKLWAEDGQLAASCTCPWAAEGNFCKHCVAVGLAWLEQDSEMNGGEPKAGKTPTKPKITPDDVRAMLESEDKGYLVDMVMARRPRTTRWPSDW